jgi:secretion/DNA translocation related TadE-like protein
MTRAPARRPAAEPASREPAAAAPPEAGAATVVALALALVIVLAAVAAIDIGALVVARSGAQTAADLAALAALTPGGRLPSQAAASLAGANGARLVACACRVQEAVVEVERAVRLLPAGPSVRLPARARAVLPARPLWPPARGAGRTTTPVDPRAAGVRALLGDPMLELTPNARRDLASGLVDGRLRALLAAILRRHRVAVSVFRTGHSRLVAGTSVVSEHTHGRAMDVFKVDGELVRPGHAPSLALVSWLAGLSGPVRPSEVGSPFPSFEDSEGHFSDGAHLDHVHIAVGPPRTS